MTPHFALCYTFMCMGETYRGVAVVTVWVLTSLIAAIGAVAALRAVTNALSASDEGAVVAVENTDADAPRPPTTVADIVVAVPSEATTTATEVPSFGPFSSTTLVVPDLRPSPTTTAPPVIIAAPPPTPTTVPPTTTAAPVPTTAAPTEVVAYQLTGGSVTVEVSEQSVVLAAASPAEGFVDTVHRAGPAVVSVRFDSSTHSSKLSVSLVRGELVATIDEDPVG